MIANTLLAICNTRFLVRLVLALPLLLAVSVGNCMAAIQTYEVQDTFSLNGFSASWLHSGVGALNGSDANGARRNGATTSRLNGTLQGELNNNNQLTDISGSISGNLMQLAGYLDSTLNPVNNFGMGDSFELKLGTAAGGFGALQFKNPGSNLAEYVGGFVEFALFVNGGNASVLDGTFFFKPQAESGGNEPLSPNRGDAGQFTLWGNNWMHDGGQIAGNNASNFTNWTDFLTGLGYQGGPVLRDGGAGLTSALGIDLYLVNTAGVDPQGGLANPEPASLFVWSLLLGCSARYTRRANR